MNPVLQWTHDTNLPAGMRSVQRADAAGFSFVLGVCADWTAHLTVYDDQAPPLSTYEDTDIVRLPPVRLERWYGDQVAAEHAAGVYLRGHWPRRRNDEQEFRLLFVSGEGPVQPERLLLWLGVALGRGGAVRQRVTLVCAADTPADRCAADLARSLGWQVEMHPRATGRADSAARGARDRAMVEAGAHVVLRWPGMGGSAHCMRLAREARIPIVMAADEERA